MMKTPLTKALDAMSCIPFVQPPAEASEEHPHTLTIAGLEAGTLYNPKVDVILRFMLIAQKRPRSEFVG